MASRSSHSLSFESAFRALDVANRPPLKWQSRLYQRFSGGTVPSTCRLPTGLGKTSVIPIWLIALANGSALPRRLVYIVNRRTVVDQATDDAKRLLRRLERPAEANAHQEAASLLRDALSKLAGDPTTMPLAISTLRGELADNGDWKKNPARPAIIIGTIDMIGSKLLFSGYGDGRHGRAHHAGLIGQDALLVHDEAHLSPAFDAVLCSIAAEQARCSESRPIRVMSLSATARAESCGGPDASSQFDIEDEDLVDPVVSQRLSARKSLTFINAESSKFVTTIAEAALALGKSPVRVLVYVRSPELAAKVAEAIRNGLGKGGDPRIAILTGTIRGKERDELAESEIFCAFKTRSDRPSALAHSLYLVSTSAGEVGADLGADHLVCDLATLDSMAQRFGRVNRLGGDGRSASITVVTEPIGDKAPLKTQTQNTSDLLRMLPLIEGGHDASPAALSTLLAKPEARMAFSPEPTILPATDILFDHWSLTSVTSEVPGRPAVEPYLHGVAEWEPPETHVAWRADIALLAVAGGREKHGEDIPCSTADLERVFEVFPLRSVEKLRDRTDRVQQQLQLIAARLRAEAAKHSSSPLVADAESQTSGGLSGDNEGAVAAEKRNTPISPNPWVVLMRSRSVEWVKLEEIAPADRNATKRAQSRLSFATVVLPVEAGGFMGGMLEGSKPARTDARSLDVAEARFGGVHDRQRILVTGEDDQGSPLIASAIAETQPRSVVRHAVTLAGDGDEEHATRVLEYRVAMGQDREPGERIGLSAHNAAVAAAATRTAMSLGLDGKTVQALALAGRLHDIGKARVIWQRYANNLPHREEPGGPVAKSDRYGRWKHLAGYRHELGSLHDARADDEVRSLSADTRDLVLHLIAAHHGWARPHFEPRHFDPGDPGKRRPTADNERLVVETMQRFARLQQRYGRWGLAWLESILRCADAEASESPAADNGAATNGGRKPTPGGVA